METLKKIKTICLSLMLVGVVFVGCKKEMPTNETANTTTNQSSKVVPIYYGGAITVKLINTNTSAAYGAANIEIIGVVVHYVEKGLGYATIPLTGNIYNLYESAVKAGVVLAEKSKMNAGRIDQIRLILGRKNTIIYGDQIGRHMLPMGIPSGENLVNLAVNSQIENSQNVTITLDFDANASINFEGNGIYLLDPVVRVLQLN